MIERDDAPVAGEIVDHVDPVRRASSKAVHQHERRLHAKRGHTTEVPLISMVRSSYAPRRLDPHSAERHATILSGADRFRGNDQANQRLQLDKGVKFSQLSPPE
jgi:hypothetical protein